MGYSRENMKRVKEAFAEKNRRAIADADEKRAAVHASVPELKKVDDAIREIGLEAVYAAISEKNGAKEKIEDLKKKSLELQEMRKSILASAGYPADYTDIHFECDKCGDTGYVGTKMCDCMKKALVLAGYESSGIAGLMRTQTFDTFSLEYYRGNAENYREMENTYNEVREYAENFSPLTSPNLFFLGNTGLGKTHLSTAVAKTVIDKGFDVLYVSAMGMIADFESERFGETYSETAAEGVGRYYQCELLIIDDVGTEISNQFTVSAFYNVINTRLIKHLPTIINTNLTTEEFRKRYWDRITSRVLGEYVAYRFVGKDIRGQKIDK